MTFQVSVITPVYNCRNYLRESVDSAHELRQVAEIILINDFGPDDSWELSRQLANELPKVRLLEHSDGVNHGAGASRNLGIASARYPYIAFLDADDWYLPNRFEHDEKILNSDPTIDGVYNAIGNHYESTEMRRLWLSQNRPETLTLSDAVPPEELPLVLWHSHPTITGEFHTDSITVRKDFFNRVGLFHEQLRLQQDTHLWKRMSVAGRLVAGNIKTPTAIRRVHPDNRMTRVADHSKYMELWFSSLFNELNLHKAPRSIKNAWYRNYVIHKLTEPHRAGAIRAFLAWYLYEPYAIFQEYGHFDQFIRTLTNNHWLANRGLSVKNRCIRVFK